MDFALEQVPEFYRNYVKNVEGKQLLAALQNSGDQVRKLYEGLTEEQSLFRYAEGKWSLKDLLQHLSDSERIFTYRALRICRNDSTALSGFEQNDYVEAVDADAIPMSALIQEFRNIRQSTIDLFQLMEQGALGRKGVCSGVEMSVEMLGYVISGHTLHHIKVIKEKYLK